MPINVVRNDITRMEVEAIVNAANKTLLGGGGVDGAIHRAAGEELYRECETLGGCLPGEAKITGGYKLPAKYIIHTVGPVWKGGQSAEEETLRACYRNSLALAKEHGIQSIAFPMISTGHYGYPKDKAFRVQTEEIRRFLNDTDMDVYIVQYERESINLYEDFERWLWDYMRCASAGRSIPVGWTQETEQRLEELLSEISRKDDFSSFKGKRLIKAFADDARRWIMQRYERQSYELDRIASNAESILDELGRQCREIVDEAEVCREKPLKDSSLLAEQQKLFEEDALFRMISNLDESFSKTLLRLIEEKGLSEVVCYKRANLDRKHFSKIRNDDSYKPSKKTALAFAVALELSYDETQLFLASAGFTLSRSSIFDVIVEYFLREKIYDIDAINATLFDYDQVLLGA